VWAGRGVQGAGGGVCSVRLWTSVVGVACSVWDRLSVWGVGGAGWHSHPSLHLLTDNRGVSLPAGGGG
jgi:hypothetical protein